jgi:cytochrome P450
MCHDPRVYNDPEVFNPDRFMGESPEPDPRNIVFGFGRRICPGKLLAEASLRIAFAMLLWSCIISPIEVDGKPQPPEYKPISGAIR